MVNIFNILIRPTEKLYIVEIVPIYFNKTPKSDVILIYSNY